MKALPKSIGSQYDLVVVSPRSYFLFTALLPASAFGSVETRSIVESARKLLEGKAGAVLLAACLRHASPCACLSMAELMPLPAAGHIL